MTTELSANIVEQTVLIVDDDDDVRLAFRTIITAAGYTVRDTVVLFRNRSVEQQ